MFKERGPATESQKESFSGIVDNSFESPRIFEGRYGKIACASDIGHPAAGKMEDLVTVNLKQNAFAVIDGMGGMGNGDIAANLVATSLEQAFEATKGPTRQEFITNIRRKTDEAAREMRKTHAGGACMIAARIVNGALQYCQAGDVRVVMMERKGGGKLVGQSDDQGSEGVVHNAILAHRPFTITDWEFVPKANRRFIIASDGIWKYFTTEEAIKLIATASIEDAIHILGEESNRRIHNEPSRADHRAVIIGDIDHL